MDINEETSKTVIHFPHIPKCGGSSFRKGLLESYGKEVFIFYRNPVKPSLQFSLWRMKNKLLPLNIPAHITIVYGHFCFDDIPTPKTSLIRRGCFFRDPIEWIGSWFAYRRNKHPNETPPNPLKFIKGWGLQDGFEKFLGSVSVETLDFVGLVENYEASLNLYEKIFGRNISQHFENIGTAPHSKTNTGRTYHQYFRDLGLLDDISDLMQRNQVIYQEAVSRFAHLEKEHGNI